MRLKLFIFQYLLLNGMYLLLCLDSPGHWGNPWHELKAQAMIITVIVYVFLYIPSLLALAGYHGIRRRWICRHQTSPA